MTRLLVHVFLLAFALFLVKTASVVAQSTVANVPSTDVVPAADVYLEFDYISNYSHHYNSGFQSYVPRVVVGIGKGVEIGANINYTDGFGSKQPIELQPNIKWQFYASEAKGLAAAVGCTGYFPVNNRAGTDTFGLCYSVVSKRIRGDYGPRFTGGGYVLVDRRNNAGAKGGAIAAYEQPLHARVNFVIDWFSGDNRFGYVTPGFSFVPTSKSTLFTGYSIGNQGRRNNAFLAFYGVRL